MKAVVASSRLGNHGHHDSSRSGRSRERTKASRLAQGPENSCLPEGPHNPSASGLQAAPAPRPLAKAENLGAFRSNCPAASKVTLNGTSCES